MKKIICLTLISVTTVYSLFYANLGGFVGNAGALSKIGLTHHILFIIWGILTYTTLCFNITYQFRNTKYKFYIPVLILSAIGMILTLSFDFDYSKHTEYMLHCIGSMTFSIITGILVFTLFLVTKKYIFAVITGAVLLVDLYLLIIYKETAIIELFPIFAGYIMLGIANLSKEREKLEVK